MGKTANLLQAQTFPALLCGLSEGADPGEYSFSILSSKKSKLSKCAGAKGVWENHCSAFAHLLNPRVWGSAHSQL